MSDWLRNTWYCAMFGTDLPPGAVASRLLLDEAIVLWRGQDGAAHAMEDRCPHRYAPLSLGKQVGKDRIRCNYHGLQFDPPGRCVDNPHGKGKLPSSAALRVYPLHEYCGIIWLWMGTGAPDTSLLTCDFPAGQSLSAGKAQLVAAVGSLRSQRRQPSGPEPRGATPRRNIGQRTILASRHGL